MALVRKRVRTGRRIMRTKSGRNLYIGTKRPRMTKRAFMNGMDTQTLYLRLEEDTTMVQ